MTLRRFLFLFYFIFVSLGAAKHRPIVMLDPAGHARDEGRKLRSEYERGATFRFAEELRKALEKKIRSKGTFDERSWGSCPAISKCLFFQSSFCGFISAIAVV